MKFYYGGNHKEAYQNLAHKPTFQQLCHYLFQHEAAILRDLKKEITNHDLEKTIDTAIKLQLVVRKDRRYRLLFPVVTPALVANIQEEKTFQLALQTLKKESDQNVLTALNYFNNLLEQDYFYGVTDAISFATATKLENEKLHLISCQLKDQTATLPGYFNALKKSELTEENSLYALLGDVELNYALDQFSYIIQRTYQKKKVRPSIFRQALVMTDILAIDDSDNLQLAVPIFDHYGEQVISLADDVFKWQLLFTRFLDFKEMDFLQFIILKG